MNLTEYNLRHEIFRLGKRLQDYEIDEDEQARIGAELVALSGVCPACKGEGIDGENPDYPGGPGGGTWACEKCSGGFVPKDVVRCFCVNAQDAAKPFAVTGYAVDDTGVVIVSRASASVCQSKYDMGLGSDCHHELYAQRYPKGFRVEWCDDPPADWLEQKASTTIQTASR